MIATSIWATNTWPTWLIIVVSIGGAGALVVTITILFWLGDLALRCWDLIWARIAR